MTSAEISRAKAYLKSTEAERPQARHAEQRGRARLLGRVRLDQQHEPRLRRPRQGRRRTRGEGRTRQGGTIGFIDSERIVKASKHKRGAGRAVHERLDPGPVDREAVPEVRRIRSSTRRRTSCSSTRGTRAARRLLYNKPELALDDDIRSRWRQPAGLTTSAYNEAFNEGCSRSRITPHPPTWTAACCRPVQYCRLHPGADPLRAVLPRPRPDRLVQLLAGGRLRGRPRLDARQLPLLLHGPHLRPHDVGDAGVVSVATAITLAVAFPFAYWLSRYVSRALQPAASSSSSSSRSGRATCSASTRG